MTVDNHPARALDPVVEIVSPLFKRAEDGMCAVLIWMPPGTSAETVAAMEKSTADFFSTISGLAETRT